MSSAYNKWRLVSGICLERPAVTTAPLLDIEKRHQDFLDEIEHQCSVLSDHELRHRDDL